jgi:hydrogenase expression/formation protein HypD
MLRVPGSHGDLLAIKAQGADVRVVYSPLDALDLARHNPGRHVVFLAIGFETTAPATALAAHLAHRDQLPNFSLLVAHVCVPPAMSAILDSPRNRVQAFLAAGHVCSVMGTWQYPPLAARYQVPIVITGFEPLDVLEGIRRAVLQLERGQAVVENAYDRVVTVPGNRHAQARIDQVFEAADRNWRGIGTIPASGLRLRPDYRGLDAEHRFDVGTIQPRESPACRAGEVLQGAIRPHECAAFGTTCTPRTPQGAPMVSTEGACAAYYHHGRRIAPV